MPELMNLEAYLSGLTITPGRRAGEGLTVSYGRFWVTTDQAAALWLISIISMPSRNLTPSMSLGN